MLSNRFNSKLCGLKWGHFIFPLEITITRVVQFYIVQFPNHCIVYIQISIPVSDYTNYLMFPNYLTLVFKLQHRLIKLYSFLISVAIGRNPPRNQPRNLPRNLPYLPTPWPTVPWSIRDFCKYYYLFLCGVVWCGVVWCGVVWYGMV